MAHSPGVSCTMSDLLTASNLVVTVDGKRIVDDVSLDQPAGTVTAVIGPNGAGKSTLLGVLSADRLATSGIVRFGDVPSDALSPLERARHRAVLRQTRAFDVPFPVWDVVQMGRHPYQRDPENSKAIDEATVEEALEQCDVLEFRDRVFSSLSGGEQARVSMARVLAQKTPLVLLDEPSGALDVGHEVLLLRQLRRLADEGRGVVAVFHDLNSAAAVADRVVLLHHGRLIAAGQPWDVLRSDVLSDVYGQQLAVLNHPFRDIPLVLPNA